MPAARLLAVLCLALSLPALANEEPEAAYARYHSSLVGGNVEAMLQVTADRQRGELNALSPEQRGAIVKNLAAGVPRSFSLRAKGSDPSGVGVRLVVSGLHQPPGAGKSETVYGIIHMVSQRGAWLVASAEWSDNEPEGLAPAKPSAPAPAAGPPPKGSPPMVGSMDAGPERKLGVQKEPCVYKPVMTAEDMERCR